MLPFPVKGCKKPYLKSTTGGWKNYTVPLDASMRKGDTKEVNVMWKPINNWPESEPHLSFSVTDPLNGYEWL